MQVSWTIIAITTCLLLLVLWRSQVPSVFVGLEGEKLAQPNSTILHQHPRTSPILQPSAPLVVEHLARVENITLPEDFWSTETHVRNVEIKKLPKDVRSTKPKSGVVSVTYLPDDVLKTDPTPQVNPNIVRARRCETVNAPQPKCNHSSKQPLRIACVGDSLTFHHRHGSAYPVHLQQYMSELHPNASVFGFGKASSTAMVNTDRPYTKTSAWPLVLEWEPHIVVMLFGINDSKKRNWVRAGGAQQFYQELLGLVNTFRNLRTAPDVIIGEPYRGYKEYAEVQWPLVTGTINSIIRRVACEERLPLFSLVTPFFKGRFTLTNGVHPTERGRQVMAQIVGDTIRNCLAGMEPPPMMRSQCLQFKGWSPSECYN
mmetsp:Transcript_123547/g.214281  ORF Transcript_123547/g.214281 Transcript_123547/m.214281 type:complete len:372 (-) Transcript_123547:307-1422(-)